MKTRYLVSALLFAATACGGKVPGGGMPGGSSGRVDPNSCGSYASTDAGAKLKLFLGAVADLDTRTQETANVVRESCIAMGKELGMSEADLGGQTKDLCAKVWTTYNDNLTVAVTGKAAFKVVYKPAVCKVDVSLTAEAAAKCEGKASADVGASCSGTCNGTCEGTCEAAGKAGTGGTSGAGQCNGTCSGTCKGECTGHADVEASAQCKAHAEAEASANVKCTEPEFSVSLDASLVVDKTKADQTLAAMQAGFPKLLAISARMDSLKAAVESTVAASSELASAGSELASSFKDQAMCVSGQIAAAANAATNIQANVSVSVEVSASASASASGG